MEMKRLFVLENPSPEKFGVLVLIAAVLWFVCLSTTSRAASFAYISNYAEGSVSVIDVAGDTVIDSISLGLSVSEPYGVFVNEDGTRAYVTSYGSSPCISEIDTGTNDVIRTMTLPGTNGGELYGIASNSYGSLLYIAYAGRNVLSVYDTAQAREIAAIAVDADPHGVVVSPDETQIYVTNYGSGSVTVINASTYKVIATITVGNGPHGIAINPSGTRVYTANVWGDTISVINTATNSVIATVGAGTFPYCPAVNADGSRVYVTNYGDGTVWVIDANTNSLLSTINVGEGPHGISFNPAGTKAYVANEDEGTVSVIDLSTEKVKAVKVGVQPIGFGRFISPKDSKHQLNATVTPEILTPGRKLGWHHKIVPGTSNGEVDMVLAAKIPNGNLFFFGPEGLGGLTNQPTPYRWGFPPNEEESYALFYDFPFPSFLPEGEYYLYNVLVRSGNIITNSKNWESNLTVSKFDFSRLSPSEKATLQSEGYPDSFVKSFSEGVEGKRVDETWVYADEGVAVSFVNGVFKGENDAFVPTPGKQSSPTTPEDYHFDTQSATIVAKHGQPLAIQEHTVWNGTFKNYIYEDMFFGFHNNSLVSAIVTNYPAVSGGNEGKRKGEAEYGVISSRTTDSVEDVNIGYLFTLASLLGAGSYSEIPGISTEYGRCMDLIKNDAPTHESLACFQDALSALSANQATAVDRNAISGWFTGFCANINKAILGTASSEEPATGSGTQPGSQVSCYASATPNRLICNTGSHDISLQFIISSSGAGEVASVRDDVNSTPHFSLTNVSNTIWEGNVNINSVCYPEGPGYAWERIGAVKSNGSVICATVVCIELDQGDLGVSIQGPQAVIKDRKSTYTAVVRGAATNYIYEWALPNNTVLRHTHRSFRDDVPIKFDKEGTYPVSVKVWDKDDTNRVASGSYSVTVSDKLRVSFVEQPYEIPAGKDSHWDIAVEGGTKPYTTNWIFTDGFAYASNIFTEVIHPGFDDIGIYYCDVTVTDSSERQQSGGVRSFILSSCVPDDCCPKFPLACGDCYPNDRTCCPDKQHACGLNGSTCCGPKCCKKEYTCCDEQACCGADEECCGGACCAAGGYCCPDGIHCCGHGYVCYPNGCCKEGYEYCDTVCCAPGSKCVSPGVCAAATNQAAIRGTNDAGKPSTAFAIEAKGIPIRAFSNRKDTLRGEAGRL